MIDRQPINYPPEKSIHTVDISPPPLPVAKYHAMPCCNSCWLRWPSCNLPFITVVLTLEVALQPRHHLPETGVGALNLKTCLIHINHVLHLNVHPPQRVIVVPEDVSLIYSGGECPLTRH